MDARRTAIDQHAAVVRAAGAGPNAAALLDLQRLFEFQRSAFTLERNPTLATRRQRLRRLLAMTDAIQPQMIQAISADFGHRSPHVTRMADHLVVRAGIDHALRHLRAWTRPRRVSTPIAFFPGRSRLRPQALGVVGIVSPWNYPYQLAISPAASALAAGNRVLIKPSEATPRFAEVLQRAIAAAFAEDELAVVIGDADVGSAFTALPFDHLFFTGSTAVGRKVALAAAANLVPVTLELGGKSPAILNADCDLKAAVPRLMAGKLLNAGQTCIAPDYVLVHRSLMAGLPDALRAATQGLYPTLAGNPDYTSIVNAHHLARLQDLLSDARAKGATALQLHPESAVHEGRLPPSALLDVDDGMRVMQEEIFGPILPLVPFDELGDAIDHVNGRDRPLALYWFGRSGADRERVLSDTVAGGVTVNDCLFHVAQENLPFGGIGASGQGSYHGQAGFSTFSHDKPVFIQSRWAGTGMMAPPYGRAFDWIARALQAIGSR